MRARLINPELVTIVPIDRANTREDSGAGEPYSQLARGSALQLKAQVDEASANRRQPAQAGADVQARTMLYFLRSDVAAAGWTPTDGDRITEVADRDGGNPRAVAWYVDGFTATAKERARAKLVQVPVSTSRPNSRTRAVGGL